MSAEAWPCLSLTCCVTLGKFLDLSEPEDPGVGEWARADRKSGCCGRRGQSPTVDFWGPIGTRGRGWQQRLSEGGGTAHCAGMGTLSHEAPPRSLQKPGGIWAEERLKMPWLETGGCGARVLVVAFLREVSERPISEQEPLLAHSCWKFMSQGNRVL